MEALRGSEDCALDGRTQSPVVGGGSRKAISNLFNRTIVRSVAIEEDSLVRTRNKTPPQPDYLHPIAHRIAE
jgi:hypothetical protein